MLRVYNTLTKRKENFKPLKEKRVNLFCCGITPYDYTHIGHAKTYVQFDIIVKYLRYLGYKVFYLQNVTDLDDKIINRARDLKKDPVKLAREFEACYQEDMKALKVDSVDRFARATDYIKEIVSQVERLIKKGYAYKISDGIYFDLSKLKDYGKLSGRTSLASEDAVSRIDEAIDKKNKGDFCLWKFSRSNEPRWNTSIGTGRPGWHIEDTAITEGFFGQQYDIHGGAQDLIFPHHEAEIAQMESISGKKPFVKYWLHTGFLNVKGEKMAKSLGNFITIRDALKRWDAKTLRFFYASTHYRSPIDFSERNLEQAKNALARLNDFFNRIKNDRGKVSDEDVKKAKSRFVSAMNDDFNTPQALAVIFDFMRLVNKKGGNAKAYNLMLEMDKILNILTKKDRTPNKILRLAEKREKLRMEKKWREADILRKKLLVEGYIIEDLKEGFNVKRL